MNSEDLDFDRNHIWHPYTSMIDPLPVYPVTTARDCKLFLDDGRCLVDGMSSWWAVIHGYGNPVINQAVGEQLGRMPHVMFGGITHQPAVDLCRRLLSVVPNNLRCVFLADSGSVAVEVALKMAVQYWRSKGDPRRKMLALRQAYHGDTLGAMSVCDSGNKMHDAYGDYIPKNVFAEVFGRRFGEIWQVGDDERIVKLLAEHNSKLAGVILEPIVQGVGGMYFYHPEYLRSVRRLCDRYGLLLIADEIATGFGRTGKLFACDHADISPDILCVGKSLTGGTMTLSAVISSREVAEVIGSGDAGCFMHGPTFMANPLACAAAIASLSIIETGRWEPQVRKIEFYLQEELNILSGHPRVAGVRVLGAIGVVETVEEVDMTSIQRWFVERGVWIRPFRRTIYLVPPYVISRRDLSKLVDAIRSALDQDENFLRGDESG